MASGGGIAFLYGCSLAFPTALPAGTVISSASPTPAVTPFSAKAFLQSSAADSTGFPLRYYSAEGAISIEIPPGWVFNQKPDSGAETDTISETYGGQAVAAVYPTERSSKEKTAQQAADIFLQSDWMAARQMEISSQAEFAFDSGSPGWKIDGTVVRDSGGTFREECILIVSVGSNRAYTVAAYPARAAVPDAFRTEFEKAVRSLRWEETNPRNFDKTDALQFSSAEPDSLDPALTHAESDGVIGDLYSGLIMLDRSLQVQPALAERWDLTPDGKTYTFHLRPNAQFQNGRPVDAGDVIFSWLRAASPELGSDTALLALGDIAGMKEYHTGQADTVSGIHWSDSATVQVTLLAPISSFPEKLTSPAASIVDRYSVRFPHWELHPNGTGPFRIVQRVAERSILLEPNPQYYGPVPQLHYVMYWITQSRQDVLYKSNKLDQMRTTGPLLPQFLDPHDPLFGNVSVEQRLCTNYITLNDSLAPLDDPLVRKALELSIDRSIYTEVTPVVGDLPGYGILPPGMPGFSPKDTSGWYDPKTAKQLLRQSHYFTGSDLSTGLALILPADGPEYDSTVEFLIDSWKRNLGVSISVEGLPSDLYQARVKAGDYGLALMSTHCASYPDPDNFYDFLFRSDSGRNQSHYRNEQMDSLLAAADSESDWNRRIALYREADQILFDDAPVIILSYSGPENVIWKPYVMGFLPTFAGVPQHQYLWISR